MTDRSEGKRDFFVSFNQVDRAWATWIAWVLEEASYSVFFQDWDFRGSFPEHMNRAHREAHRTLAVLSDNYLSSEFARSEAWARYAQDAVGQEDRLVPVKVGPLSHESILHQFVYADLTSCDEEEAHRRLLGRIKRAIDANYRDKPQIRPGFPGSSPRKVLSRPEFPPAGNKPVMSRDQEERVMVGDRSVNVGRDAVDNIITTGDSNRVDATIHAEMVKTTLPPAGSVDIGGELAAIRAVLERLGGEQAGKVGRALDDAEEEARKPQPDKDEVGAALGRALDYVKKGSGFAEEVARLAPHVRNAVGWLGASWHKLLPLVGLTA